MVTRVSRNVFNRFSKSRLNHEHIDRVFTGNVSCIFSHIVRSEIIDTYGKIAINGSFESLVVNAGGVVLKGRGSRRGRPGLRRSGALGTFFALLRNYVQKLDTLSKLILNLIQSLNDSCSINNNNNNTFLVKNVIKYIEKINN